MKRLLCLAVAVLVCLGAARASASGVDDLILMGADYHYRGELDKAAQAFSRARSMAPDNEFVLNQLALINAKLERYDQAMPLFRRVVAISPRNTFARIWIGVLHLRQGRAEDAFAEFRRVLSIDPNNANAYYFLGVMYSVEHNMAKAVEYLRKAQQVSSEDPDIHHRLATAFLGLDMPANAELEFTRTLELNPRHTKALNGLGWLFYNQGRRSLALDSWGKALKINSSDQETRSNLAKVYNDEAYAAFLAGNRDRARKLWSKTLEHEPRNKAALYYLRK